MLKLTQPSVRNQLLRALTPEQFDTFLPLLEPVSLVRDQAICEPYAPIEWAVFPEAGLVSVLGDELGFEVGIYGRDGVGPIELLLSGDVSAMAHRVQMPGHGCRVRASALSLVLATDSDVRALFQRYALAHTTQVALAALVGSTLKIQQRLARRILMAHDRIDGDELHLTHDVLGKVLGVRRTGVTLAIHMLEGEKMIRTRRGIILVLDRTKLMKEAHQGYGTAEKYYERLIGFSPSGVNMEDLVEDWSNQMTNSITSAPRSPSVAPPHSRPA